MSVWAELRRRNVFKVGVAYVVAAWLIAQVVDVVKGPLDLPAWFDSAVIVFLGVGFPVALLLAWAYELTPEGIRRTKQVPLAESIRHLTGQRLNYIVTGLLVLAVGFMAVDDYLLDRSPRSENAPTAVAPGGAPPPAREGAAEVKRKVAVLPCENLSPNPDDAYFAAGIHEEILNQLAKIQSLLVVARTSVMRYAETKPPVPEIARELGATAIMECSVRYAGDAILVTAQLIDPKTDSHLWSETYPGSLADLSTVFAMQAEIAMNIANALEAEFSPAEQARLESAPTDSPEAYALFLAALARGDDAPETRVDLLEQAVAIDPEFALAHADIAFALAQTTLNTINSSASRTWNDAGARATASAERALALDPNVEVAHAARAIIDQLSWRWPEARAGFARAYELNPNEPVVLWLYAWFSGFSGAAADAARLAERLGELRPNETEALAQQSVALAHAGDVDGAAATCRRALELEPDFVFCRHGLGINLARRGDVAGAMAQFELEEQLLGRNRLVAFLPDIAIAYSQIGRDDDVARLVAEVEAMGEQMDIGAGGHAAVYVAAGDREKALQWLRVAVEKAARHEPDAGFFELMSLRSNVFGHPMLDEPEFRELRAQLGVP